MKRVYLVDFENVHDSGLIGIEQLHKRDQVIIFYSSNANKIGLDSLISTKATLKFIKAECGTANALDFQLVAYLCRKAKKWNKYYIVSKDKGYTPVIRLLANEGIKVFEANTIKAFFEKSGNGAVSDPEKIIPMDILQNTKHPEKDSSYYEEKVAENDPVTEIAVIIMEKIGVYPADDMIQTIISLNKFDEKEFRQLLDDKGRGPVYEMEKEFNMPIHISDIKKDELAHDAFISGLGVRGMKNAIRQYIDELTWEDCNARELDID